MSAAIEVRPCASHCLKHFMCINSFNSHNSLHYTNDKTEGIKMLNNSPTVTQLIVDEVQI